MTGESEGTGGQHPGSAHERVVAVVTGGGTSGHIVPALAILESLEEAGVDASQLGFVGTSRGADRALVESSDLAARALARQYLPMSGLQRGASVRALRRNLALPWRLARSRIAAARLVKHWQPRVVVSVGGYASEPMVRAARAAGVAVVCVSYDAVPGLATRGQARRSRANAVAFEGIDLPRAQVTGAPVRRAVLEIAARLGSETQPVDGASPEMMRAREEMDLRTEMVVVVAGGSLGSGTLNGAIPGLVGSLAREVPGRCTLVHVCGERNADEPMPAVADSVTYRRIGYEPRLPLLFAAADLVVTRAGASTVAEIAALGRAAVVVPWEAAADAHQERNARWLAGAGGAVVVSDAAVRDGALAGVVVGLLHDGVARRDLARAARRLGADARSGSLRRLVLEHAGLRPRADSSLGRRRRIHVVGAGGPGMSALAHLLADMGHEVTGSDVVANDAVRRLAARGVAVHFGHDPAAVEGCDIVTYSTAVPADNVELCRARDLGATVVHRSEVLASACASTKTLGILGTHGKTTTTAVLASMLEESGLSPSWLVGGDSPSLGESARWGTGGIFVVEADESDATHERLALWGAVLTNVDEDHLERYGSIEALHRSFASVLERCPGPVMLCADDEGCRHVWDLLSGSARARTLWWGSETAVLPRGAHAALLRSTSQPRNDGIVFRARLGPEATTQSPTQVFFPVHGEHNASNVAGALLASVTLGGSLDSSLVAARSFAGVGRRLEHKGTAGGVDVIDDYAHVPSEIRAALSAVRQRHPGRRVVAVFQPNRYHRVRDMHDRYAGCFDAADVAVITDIYASGTAPIPGVTGQLVADAVRGAAGTGGPEVIWAPTRADVVEAVMGVVRPGDVCLGMGCGDIGLLSEEILPALAAAGSARDGSAP